MRRDRFLPEIYRLAAGRERFAGRFTVEKRALRSSERPVCNAITKMRSAGDEGPLAIVFARFRSLGDHFSIDQRSFFDRASGHDRSKDDRQAIRIASAHRLRGDPNRARREYENALRMNANQMRIANIHDREDRGKGRPVHESLVAVGISRARYSTRLAPAKAG